MDKLKQILIATKNIGKVNEFKALFSQMGIEVKSLLDFPEVTDIEETGSSFVENAVLKAEAISVQFNEVVIADDSGLTIDVLNGRPGIFSARYAGEEKNDQANNKKVLSELVGVPFEKRKAHFQCALAVAFPQKETITVEGVCDGYITEDPVGNNGFGYDPIFFIVEKNKTMAQLTKEEKNKISHRALALAKLSKMLEMHLKEGTETIG